MARLARVVVPGLPHHITQRGNCRQQTFFCDEDYRSYLELMGQWCGARQVENWAYCLMPNHVQFDRGAPVRGRFASGRRRGTSPLHPFGQLSRRLAWAPLAGGALPRSYSTSAYLLTAARYVELNPVARD